MANGLPPAAQRARRQDTWEAYREQYLWQIGDWLDVPCRILGAPHVPAQAPITVGDCWPLLTPPALPGASPGSPSASWGRQVRDARRARGWTVQQLANAVHCTRSEISDLECLRHAWDWARARHAACLAACADPACQPGRTPARPGTPPAPVSAIRLRTTQWQRVSPYQGPLTLPSEPFVCRACAAQFTLLEPIPAGGYRAPCLQCGAPMVLVVL